VVVEAETGEATLLDGPVVRGVPTRSLLKVAALALVLKVVAMAVPMAKLLEALVVTGETSTLPGVELAVS